jgi:hypothetical protein
VKDEDVRTMKKGDNTKRRTDIAPQPTTVMMILLILAVTVKIYKKKKKEKMKTIKRRGGRRRKSRRKYPCRPGEGQSGDVEDLAHFGQRVVALNNTMHAMMKHTDVDR